MAQALPAAQYAIRQLITPAGPPESLPTGISSGYPRGLLSNGMEWDTDASVFQPLWRPLPFKWRGRGGRGWTWTKIHIEGNGGKAKILVVSL